MPSESHLYSQNLGRALLASSRGSQQAAAPKEEFVPPNTFQEIVWENGVWAFLLTCDLAPDKEKNRQTDRIMLGVGCKIYKFYRRFHRSPLTDQSVNGKKCKHKSKTNINKMYQKIPVFGFFCFSFYLSTPHFFLLPKSRGTTVLCFQSHHVKNVYEL